MHTWVRRGLPTAIVTSGLLMLGTSIASADETLNPDLRLPSLPGNDALSVPVAPSLKDVGLADAPQALSVPTTPGAVPSAPAVQSVASAPDVPLAPMAQSVDQAMSHLEVRPDEAPTSTEHVVQELRSSPLGALPGVPGVPARKILGALPGASNKPINRASSTLPHTQAAQVTPSGKAAPAIGPDHLGALPGVPNLSGAPNLSGVQGLADKLGTAAPPVRGAVVTLPVFSGMLTSLAQQAAKSANTSNPNALPGVSTVTAAPKAVPDVTGFAAPVRRGVNDSPLGTLPGAPNVPAVPTTGNLLNDITDVASSPTHVTKMAELPGSGITQPDLPSAPVESVGNSPVGTMLGVPTVRDGVVHGVTAPMDQLDQVPGMVSGGINNSPFALLPGHPTVPTVPSLPELAGRTANQPLVSNVTDSAANAVHTSQLFGKPSEALPGVSDTKEIAGVLPVVQNLFPQI